MKTFFLSCYAGNVAVQTGTTFPIPTSPFGTHPEGTYQVLALLNLGIYSPSGLGGTPIIQVQHLESGETFEFCGDSVAHAVHRASERASERA